MANRDPSVFDEPNEVVMDRKGNRHFSFGIGVHRCVGSNVARTVFKSMLTAVLDRMPDYVCDPEGTEHYETIGVIQGMKHLPATFTPGKRLGPGLDETLENLQRICDEQQSARPITEHKDAVVIDWCRLPPASVRVCAATRRSKSGAAHARGRAGPGRWPDGPGRGSRRRRAASPAAG